jgi:hypothetical protein
MTAASDEPDNADRERPQDKGSTRLSINLSAETAEALRELAARKGVSITEGIRRAIAAWQFLEVEASKGNRIAVIEQDGSIRTVVLL